MNTEQTNLQGITKLALNIHNQKNLIALLNEIDSLLGMVNRRRIWFCGKNSKRNYLNNFDEIVEIVNKLCDLKTQTYKLTENLNPNQVTKGIFIGIEKEAKTVFLNKSFIKDEVRIRRVMCSLLILNYYRRLLEFLKLKNLDKIKTDDKLAAKLDFETNIFGKNPDICKSIEEIRELYPANP